MDMININYTFHVFDLLVLVRCMQKLNKFYIMHNSIV